MTSERDRERNREYQRRYRERHKGELSPGKFIGLHRLEVERRLERIEAALRRVELLEPEDPTLLSALREVRRRMPNVPHFGPLT